MSTALVHIVSGFVFGSLLYFFVVYLSFCRLMLPFLGIGREDGFSVPERLGSRLGPRWGPLLTIAGLIAGPVLCLMLGVMPLLAVYVWLDLDARFGVDPTYGCALLTRHGRIDQCMEPAQWLGIVPAVALGVYVHFRLREDLRRLRAFGAARRARALLRPAPAAAKLAAVKRKRRGRRR